jgi:hypothetical protein
MELARPDKIAQNGQYTFRFQSDGYLKKSEQDIRYALESSTLPISDVNVKYEGGVAGLFSGSAVVSFKWNAVGWTVQKVAENMEAVLSAGLGNYTFVNAQGGTEVDTTGGALNLTSGKLAWIAIAIVIAFAFAAAFGHRAADKIL